MCVCTTAFVVLAAGANEKAIENGTRPGSGVVGSGVGDNALALDPHGRRAALVAPHGHVHLVKKGGEKKGEEGKGSGGGGGRRKIVVSRTRKIVMGETEWENIKNKNTP